MNNNNINLRPALALARKGIYVHPLKPGAKQPLTERGYLDATIDEATIRTWWTKWPNANIGVACKQSKIVIVDIDQHPGRSDGLANFKKLEGRQKLPKTVKVKTPHGWQYWFRAPKGIEFNGNLCDEVQLKHKGYGIAPPSLHPSGGGYKYINSLDDCDVALLPKWMYPHAIKSMNKIKTKSANGAHNDDISDKEVEEIGRRFKQASMPPADAEQVIQNCNFLTHCVTDAEILSEPVWYHGTVGVLSFCENGTDAVHKYSASYPDYSYKETQEKIKHRLADSDGPTLCKTLQEHGGNQYCKKCPFKGKIKSPITLGYANKKLEGNKKKPVVFPVDVFPAEFADYANAAAKSLRCPPDYCFVLILSLVAILIGNRISIKITADWIRYASVWIAIVGRPGDKKSPALEQCVIKPLKLILAELKRLFDFAKSAYEVELSDYRTAIKNFNKDKTNSGSPPTEPVKPYLKQIITSDTTIEALGEIIEKNPLGVGIVCDELSGFLRSHNQYKGGRGADRSHYLAMRNNAPIIINRKGKDAIYLNKPYVPIAGCLQPDTVSEIRKYEGTRQGVIDDGLLERFDFSCPARCNEPPGNDIPISNEVNEKFSECVHRLFESRLLDDRIIELSDEAREQFIKAETEWHDAINSPDFDPNLETFYSKMPGKLGEYILILHEMKCTAEQTYSDLVEESTVIAAKKIADYFLAHAQMALGLISKTIEERRVEQAFKWIQAKGLRIVQARDLIAYKVAGVRKKSEAIDLMKSISDYGYCHLDSETNSLISPIIVSKSAKSPKTPQENI